MIGGRSKALRLKPDERDIVSRFAFATKEADGVESLREKISALAEEFSSSAWLADFAGAAWRQYDPKDWAKAAEWHEKAVRLKPDEHDIVSHYVFATKEADGVEVLREKISALAEEFSSSGWLADFAGAAWRQYDPKDLAKAAEWHEKAVRLKPDQHEVLDHFGTVLLEQAKSKTGEEAERLFVLAEGKLARAEEIHPGSGAYNLGCLASLRSDVKNCRKWLEKSKECGTLPSHEHLMNDPDLKRYRKRKWFIRLTNDRL